MRSGRCGGDASAEAIARIEQNLREQVAAEERLLAALEGQHESMRRLAGGDLAKSVDDAGAAAAAIARLQSERRALLEAAAGARSGTESASSDAGSSRCPASAGSIAGASEDAHPSIVAAWWTGVLERVPAATRERLAALRQEARRLAERITRVNGINGRVSERARAHFTGLLALVAGGGGSTYTPVGRGGVAVSHVRASALIDRVA